MPSFQDAIENKLITDEQLWRVAQYVQSLSPEKTPEVREVVKAALEQKLPATPDDAAWGTGGALLDSPRRTDHRQAALVRAHGRRRLGAGTARWASARLPSVLGRSVEEPRSDLGRVARPHSKTLTDVDGALATQQGPDRLVVEWAQSPSDESKRPYFLGGDAKSPVYAWRWSSELEVEEGTEAGLGHSRRPANGTRDQTARYADGQWQVRLHARRSPRPTRARSRRSAWVTRSRSRSTPRTARTARTRCGAR